MIRNRKTYEKTDYNTVKADLERFCKKHNLRLIEAELKNEKICYVALDTCIILNKKYHKFLPLEVRA